MNIAEARQRSLGSCLYKTGCDTQLVPQSSWLELSPGDRREMVTLGYGAHAARRLCYKHRRLAVGNGTLDDYANTPVTFNQPEVLVQQYEATPCLNQCGRMTITKWAWEQLDAENKGELRRLGFACHGGRGLCRTCHDKLSKRGGLDQFPHLVQPEYQRSVHKRFDIPKLWAEVQEEGGDIDTLAGIVGVTPTRVRDVFKQLGIPMPKHRGQARAEEKLEDIEFLHSCGCGTHEIALKLGMGDEELIEYVRNLRMKGKTTVDLQYSDLRERTDVNYGGN